MMQMSYRSGTGPIRSAAAMLIRRVLLILIMTTYVDGKMLYLHKHI